MIKVKDYPNLVRDPNSKAIINADQSAYREYKQKNIVKDRLATMDNEINTIKESVDEIKNLLKQLVQK
tara:strand:+ start:2426 stop:2629 length:204 start_codon:yes stop_codon:yes gene_type:complete